MSEAARRADSVGAMFLGSRGGYLVGFALALLLTAAAFAVSQLGLGRNVALVALAALAVLQITVHLVYFLHLHASAWQRWNLMALGFAVWVMLILLAGSLWIMLHLRANMMPGLS
jgi:cytochrome o ubiquinol oxidase operon protein cyoD